VGAALWVGAAGDVVVHAAHRRQAGPVYGSFAGVVATLVFLYISATT
jgi:membrane protein